MTSSSYENNNMLIFKHRHSKITGKLHKDKIAPVSAVFSPMIFIDTKWKIPEPINSFIKWY